MAQFVRFLGFEAKPEDENEDQRFDFDRLKFSERPAWLEEVMNAGRIHIGTGPVPLDGTLPKRALIYSAPDNWYRVPIEEGAYLIDRGKGVLRVVDATTFDVVRNLGAKRRS